MKKIYLILLLAFNGYFIAYAQSYTINTYAGSSAQGFSGDGGPATAAELNEPWGVALDAAGNVYVADHSTQTVRVINTSSTITTVAGIGNAIGYYGDGGPATAAELNTPTGVAVDASGNIYIAVLISNRVRVVNTSGIISTYAGNGAAGFSGDGGQATAAEFDNPSGVAVDASGNLYVSDFYNFRVRKINTSGIISTVAGKGSYGYSGDGGQATAADIGSILGVAVDGSGNIYIPDESNGRIRKVNTNGVISTIAGNGVQSFSGDGGQATAAELSYPYGVCTDSYGNVYIADYNNFRIRYVNTSGVISTVAGCAGGFYGDGGPAVDAELGTVTGVIAKPTGLTVYVADEGNYRIRVLTPLETGIAQPSIDNQQLTVYPNPSNGIFTFLMKNEKLIVKNIEVFNALWEQVSSQLSTFNSQLSLNLSSQPSGVYFYKAVGNDGSIIGEGKIVIQK